MNAIFDLNGQYKEKKIGLYGIGKNAEMILKNEKDYNINCLIATEKIGEIIYGKKVLTLEEACKKVEIIVVAATIKSGKIIYERIKNQVPPNIKILDMRGREAKSKNYIYKTEYTQKNLINKIESSRKICFDFLDTMVFWKTIDKKKVFEIIEKTLKNGKINIPYYAIRTATEKALEKSTIEVTQDNIYKYIIENNILVESIANKIRNIEEEYLSKYICVRTEIINIIKNAQRDNKEIIIMSEEFDKEFIEKLLEKNGLKNIKIVERDSTKDLNKQEKILYVSSREKKYWMENYFYIETIKNLIKKSAFNNILEMELRLDDYILLGTVISEVLNNPFCLEKGKIYFPDIKKMVKCCFFPITIAFMAWLCRTVNNKEAIILFTSRDGYYLHKIYQKIKKYNKNLPNGIYFYSSRQIAKTASIIDENDIKTICATIKDKKNEDMNSYLNLNLGIIVNDFNAMKIEEVLDKYGYENIEVKILLYQKEILNKSKRLRENYLGYINNLNVENYKEVYLVDLVTQGSILKGLRKICSNNNIKLLCFGTNNLEEDYKKQLCYSMFGERNGMAIFELYAILELVYASIEGQFAGIDIKGRKILKDGTEYNENLLSEINLAMDACIEEYTEIDFKWYEKEYSLCLVDAFLEIIAEKNSIVEEDIENLFDFEDPFDLLTPKLNVLKRDREKCKSIF